MNSQEWTLSRSVPDLRLGIVGSLSSGKSALVHRYLTGSYMQEESPEGGRFKKEILVDNQSYLLLIRDEGGPPELQVREFFEKLNNSIIKNVLFMTVIYERQVALLYFLNWNSKNLFLIYYWKTLYCFRYCGQKCSYVFLYLIITIESVTCSCGPSFR